MTTTRTFRNCIDCDAPLRPERTSENEWPGTTPHKGRGLCSKHYMRRKRAGTLDEVPHVQEVPATEDLTTERIEKMRRDTIDYHRGWRRRNGLDVTAPIDLREIVMA